MTAFADELQAAIVTALKAADIAGGRIYDRANKDAAKPYVSIGPSDETAADADCIDGIDVAQQLDVWSDGVGYPEVKTIAAQIRRALHRVEIDVHGTGPVEIVVRAIRYLREGDGLTSHAAIDLRASV